MKKEGLFVSVILVIFLVNFASAGFTLGNPNHEIKTLYGPGDAITGWINISLNNEPTSSILESSLGGSISLINLINKASNSGFVKTCNTLDCVSNYVTSSPATSKIINLNENESVLLGFSILGNARDLLTSISGFTFNLTSNNPETEKFTLSIDILNDGDYEWNAHVPSDNFGSENNGCFEIKTGQANIAETSYCERIRLPKTPEVELGAYIQGNTPGIYFIMTIESVDGNEHGTCTTDLAVGAGVIERVSCPVLSFSINEQNDYFVCIKTSNRDDAIPPKYKINIEEDSHKCGFTSPSGDYEGSYNYDFDIFARPKMYLGGINFTLNDDELINSKSYLIKHIEEYLEDYISEVYANNCSKGCVIPMKISSGVSQQITLSNTYGVDPYIISYIAGISTTTDKFYNIAETPALINSGLQKLSLGESGFRVQLENGNQIVSIKLKNSEGENVLFSEEINVGGSPGIKSLTPTSTGVKYPTKFTVLLNASINPSKYSWNFGDGQIQNTTIGEVTHTYNAAGSYMLKISLLDLSGTVISLKEFNVTVAPASVMVSTLLTEAETKINLIKTQLHDFSSFEQKAVNYSLKLSQIEGNITKLKTSASKASSEITFEAILGELLGMKIPISVAKTTYSDGIIFYPASDNIDLNALKQVGGGDYEANKEEQYREAILKWNEENINNVLVYQEISAIYSDYQEPFLRIFDLTATKSGSENAYIVIADMENIYFKDGTPSEKEGYYYINFDDSEKHIVFSTTENFDFVNLPLFISPPISQLTLEGWTPYTKEGQLKKWILFSIIAVIIIIIAIVVYVILQIWYKKKYESSLFKNRNNLYNLVNYIQNEKNKGTREGQIVGKLRKTGWTSEQIRYALRKHAGKRTGMPEIPVGKILKEKNNKEMK